jgi:hypothetical protein
MQNLIASLLIAITVLGGYGCAAVMASLPAIIAAIQSSSLIVNQIESFVNLYFQLNPNTTNQQKVADAIAKLRTALVAAQAIANGVDKMDQGQIDAAFVEIRNAYTDLVSLCGSLGIGVKMTGKSMKADYSAGTRTLIVPEPMIFSGKV